MLRRFSTCAVLLVLLIPVWAKSPILNACYESAQQFPYYIGDGYTVPKNAGVSIDIVRTAANNLGYQVVFQRRSWDACLKLLGRNEIDLIFNGSFKSERTKLGQYPMDNGKPDASRRITTLSYAFYTMIDNDISWDGESLTGVKFVGAPKGYSIISKLENMGIAVEEGRSTSVLLDQMVTGYIGIIAAQTVTADHIIKNNDVYKNVIKLEPLLVTKPYFVLVSHKLANEQPDLVSAFWSNIAYERENISKHIDKYIAP